MVNRWHRALGLGLLLAGLASSCGVFLPNSQAEPTSNGDLAPASAAHEALAIAFADWLVEAQVEREIPGMAVALVYQDQILLLENWGYRDLERELPVTPHTLFHIGSTHKSMTALLAAIAVDRNLFTWDDPLIEFVPAFELSHPEATATVTMRHLLSMRSGISDDAVDELMLKHLSNLSLFDRAIIDVSALDLFGLVAEIDLLDAPGDIFDYSNVAVSLAGYLTTIAAVGNPDALVADHETLLQNWILEPIGMEDAVLQWSDAQASGDVALPYIWDNRHWAVAPREDFDGDILAPSGGLKASITDMAAYLITQVQGGVTPQGQRLVSAENWQATWQPHWGDYAMGWEVETYRGVEILGHSGLFDNFASVIGRVPDYEIGFVVLTNSNDAAEDLMPEIGYQLVDILLELE